MQGHLNVKLNLETILLSFNLITQKDVLFYIYIYIYIYIHTHTHTYIYLNKKTVSRNGRQEDLKIQHTWKVNKLARKVKCLSLKT